ncbi:isoprenylcysteine carboxylmethyltransferase family protein [bacterium]|nr:isoprenylcysteine carboxylmethyltransferase family protein [bacterium]
MARSRTKFAFLLSALSLCLVDFHPEFVGLSLVFVGPGEALRIWAAGYRYKGQISTGGPYGFVRNPMYWGSTLVAFGLCAIAGSVWTWLLAISYFTAISLPAIKYEEESLREKFPVEFQAYSADVPAFYPTLRSYHNLGAGFSRKQLLRNKEHLVILAIILAYSYLSLSYGNVELWKIG